MEPRERTRRTWRWGLVTVLAVAGLVVAWWRPSEQAPHPTEPSTSEHARATASEPPRALPPTPAIPPKTAPTAEAVRARSPAPPPVIDEVTVEKKEVCSGEDNLISVRAHSPDGDDSHLHTLVGTGTGMRVPLRVWMNPDGTYELPQVTVFGRDNVQTSVVTPRYTVKPCEPDRIVEIFSRRLPNSTEDYEFLARLIELPHPEAKSPRAPFVPVKYVWTFDDRDTVTTTGSLVAHALTVEASAPRRMFSQHLVRVDVFDAAGKKVTGRSSVQLLDDTFENFDKKGVVTVLAEGSPRFPELGSDGVVRQKFRLFHRWKGAVRLERVTALRARTPEAGAPPLPESAEDAALGVDVLPEGRGVEVSVTLDTQAEPDVALVTYSLEGTTEDGHPARGAFSLMRPPARPTREHNTPVTDPVMTAKIKKARELLGQEFVTDEDLYRLEREGRFAGLGGER